MMPIHLSLHERTVRVVETYTTRVWPAGCISGLICLTSLRPCVAHLRLKVVKKMREGR